MLTMRKWFSFCLFLWVLLLLRSHPAGAAPTITAKNPADGATSVPVSTSVTATFNEAMDPGTLTGGTFSLAHTGAKAVAAGDSCTLALKFDGTVSAWGYTGNNQTMIPAGLTSVTAISAGTYHSVALKNDGTVVAWGAGSYGQTAVPSGLTNVTAIAAGGYHTVALKNDGTVVAWGLNNYGQTTVPADLSGVTAVAAGVYHTIALKSDGTLIAWGYNTYGQTTIPAGLTNVTAVAAGIYHTVALKSDGTVVAWGNNSWGQSTVPAGLTNVTAVATGTTHTVALKSDGTVVAWGDNGYGQTTVPVGLTGVTAIAANRSHTVALKNDGTVVAWGSDSNGESTAPAPFKTSAVSGVVAYDEVTNTATFTPASPLLQGAIYKAVVSTATSSASGVHPAANTVWTFSTLPTYGPTYPPPGGVTRTDTGAVGAIGRTGGMTWTFDNVALAATNPTWWGPAEYGVAISFDGNIYTGSEIHSYQAAQSNLANGVAVWTGQTQVNGIPIYTRFTLTTKKGDGSALPLTSAATYGLPASVGAVAPVTAGQSFKANFIFEASTSPSGPFQPAYNLFDYYHSLYNLAYGVYSSFTAGFYYQNAAPTITGSADLVLQKGGSATYNFTVADAESGTSNLTISATSSNQTLIPNGNLVLGGSGANRTLTVTAASGTTGSAIVTLSIFDGISTSTKAVSVLVNSPPQLTANNQLQVDRGSISALSGTVLQATDVESAAAQLVYTLAAGGDSGGPPHEGTLKLSGTALAASGTFTQKDIDDGLVQYVHNGNCGVSDDFQFSVKDGNNASIPTGSYTSYSFRIAINHPNRLPVAVNGSAGVSMGRTYEGTLSATNDDCSPQALTYRIVSNGSKGNAVVTGATSGAFTYTPNQGATGTDSFTFQVNDGIADAASAGTITVNIANQAPVAAASSGTTAEKTALSGTLAASDLDLPAQRLTYAIASNGSKGTAVISDASTGSFTYTPNDGAFGTDTFSFTASDGELTSAPATYTVNVRPQLKAGRVLVTNGKNGEAPGSIAIFDPASSQQGVFASGGMIVNPHGIAVEADGKLVVVDEDNGVIRIDPLTGNQVSVVGPGVFQMPIGIAVEQSGALLVGTMTGLYRVNPGTGAIDHVFTGGEIDFPAGVRVSANGDIVVTDVGAFANKPSQVLRIDPSTDAQTVISSGGNLGVPADLLLLEDGRIAVADGPMGASNIIVINPADGTQQVLATGGSIASPGGVAYAGGKILVASAVNSSIVAVDPVTGAQTVLASGGAIASPFSIMVVPAAAAVNGACGPAHASVASAAPTSSLCDRGTASAVTGSGPWSWQCAGVNGGTSGYCSAAKLASTLPSAITGQPSGDYTGGKQGTTFTVRRQDASGTSVTAYSGGATSFTDTATLKPNTIYQYSVASDSDPTQTVFLTVRTPLYYGWNIVAVPYNTAGTAPAALFGKAVSAVYQWVPGGATPESSDSVLGTYNPVTSLAAGYGYFVKTATAGTTFLFNGATAPQSATVTLKPGWTMIANPNSTVKTDIASNWIVDGAPLGTAVVANKIGGGIYWWNGTTYDSWSIVSGNPKIEPWKGYWILNLDSVDHTLTITQPEAK